MFNIEFYKDKRGNESVKDYIISLKCKNTKNSLIKLQKIRDYINVLKKNGVIAGKSYVKHLDGEIWELRPLRDRILFFCFNGDTIVLLSHFRKTTKKTPKKEIEKAERLRKKFIERSEADE